MEEKMSTNPQFPEAELARLADGSLPEARAAELRAEIAESPQLQQAIAEQERALALVRSASDTPAPDSLRRWVDEQARAATPARQRPRPRLRIGFAVPAIAALAAAVVVVVVVATGGSSSGPSLDQTSRLALAAASSGPPAVVQGDPVALNVSNAGIEFPNWQPTLGWRATGARVDKVAGRTIVTVFYTAPKSYRVGYAIVSGSPITVKGGVTRWHHGVKYTFVSYGRTRLVTWERQGHTCVIAGRSVDDETLLHLATV
jgi:hypothetical protein